MGPYRLRVKAQDPSTLRSTPDSKKWTAGGQSAVARASAAHKKAAHKIAATFVSNQALAHPDRRNRLHCNYQN